MAEDDRSRRLMFAGFLLFLAGLVTGLFLPVLPYPRLGQGAHITAVMNGMFLILLGLVWDRLRLGSRAASWVAGLVLYGTWANWGFSLLASILGTGKLTPLASGGQIGEPWKEAVVGAGQVTLALAMLTALAIIVWSLRKPAAQ
jgi:(hydroxyamino)benzene mutase